MNLPRSVSFFASIWLFVASGGMFTAARAADEELPELEENAIRAAVERISAATVSVEAIGGLERAGPLRVGAGPSTGLIVSSDGYIVSSAFDFAENPQSILVGLPNGKRAPARRVAVDHSLLLALLKIESPEPLTVAKVAPASETRVGQWSIAVGRALDRARPNLSVGIVSARSRIWGKALQTDAKISPSNYGGPLIDIRGRVLGVLSPLSPDKGNEQAGVEWYDSGIGFAVPISLVMESVERLKAEKDLYSGVLGISLGSNDLYEGAATIAACPINSPAQKAGLRAQDIVIGLNGREIKRPYDLMEAINRMYAGDIAHVVVARGAERLERDIELAQKLEPYARPRLGILPDRDPASQVGVGVRYVFPASPAAEAGIRVGDRILTVNGEKLTGRDDLNRKIAVLEIGVDCRLGLARVGQSDALEVTFRPAAETMPVPREIPVSLPRAPFEGEKPTVGAFPVKVPELANESQAIVPESYDPRVPLGLVVLFHPAGGWKDSNWLEPWRGRAAAHDLILFAPKSRDPAKWGPEDIEFATKALDQLSKTYAIDSERVVAYGEGIGGAAAQSMAGATGSQVHGVALLDSGLSGPPPESDPLKRFSYFFAWSSKARDAKRIDAQVTALRKSKRLVVKLELSSEPRPLNDTELDALIRWVDSLDRV